MSASQRRGDGVTTAQLQLSASPCSAKLLVSSQQGWGALRYLVMVGFYEVHMGGLPALLVGSQPPVMLAFVPVCGSVNPAALEQQVCDLVTRLFVGRVSVVAAIIGSSDSLSLNPPRCLIGRLAKEERRRQSKGLWDKNYPGEKGGLSSATSQAADGTSCRLFDENRKLSLCPSRSVNWFKYIYIYIFHLVFVRIPSFTQCL